MFLYLKFGFVAFSVLVEDEDRSKLFFFFLVFFFFCFFFFFFFFFFQLSGFVFLDLGLCSCLRHT